MPYELISIAYDGTNSNGDSLHISSGSGDWAYYSTISNDGRFLVFRSDATNLVETDTNGHWDMFVHDRQTDTTTLVSVATDGTQANSASGGTQVSDDGRYALFASSATNLVSNDTNGYSDLFIRDLHSGTTERVSVATDGTQANNHVSGLGQISDDGRFVLFVSRATNLVQNGTNGNLNLFVRDLQSGTTEQVNVASDGSQANDHATDELMSVDGRFVFFYSRATNLVSNDTNGQTDLFVRDLQAGTTERVNVASDGSQASGTSVHVKISDDGRYALFGSTASNLVSDDTNGEFDLFVRDLQNSTTERVNVASNETEANGTSTSWSPTSIDFTGDGRFVLFISDATNLAPNDTNSATDVFLREVQAGTTELISVATDGSSGNGSSSSGEVSDDGRFVLFRSHASDLVAGDDDGKVDFFLRDRLTGATRLLETGIDSSWDSKAQMSGDGRIISFQTEDGSLVAGDTNGYRDVFVMANPFLDGSPNVNSAPTAIGNSTVLSPGSSVLLADLFGWSDPDGLADIVSFAVRDRSLGAGYLTRDGERQSDTVLFDEIPISEIGLWAFVAGPEGSSDTIGFNAIDAAGNFNLPSATATVLAATVGNAPVVVGPASHALDTGGSVNLSTLVTFADANGAADIVRVRVWDSTVGEDGGRLHLDGNPVGASYVDVTPGTLNRVTYVAGPQSGSNAIVIEAFDASGNDSNDHRVSFVVAGSGGNAAPVAVADIAVAPEDGSVDIDVLGNDTDPDGDVLRLISASGAAHGLLSVNIDGTVHYTPNFGFSGEDSFAYRMTDGSDAGVTGNVTVTVLSEEYGGFDRTFFALSAGEASEGEDLVFTITRSGDLSQAASVTFDIDTSSGTAGSGDYSFIGPVTRNFAPLQEIETVRVAITDDSNDAGGDPDSGTVEELIGTLQSPVGGLVTGARSVGRIVDLAVSPSPAGLPNTGVFNLSLAGGTWIDSNGDGIWEGSGDLLIGRSDGLAALIRVEAGDFLLRPDGVDILSGSLVSELGDNHSAIMQGPMWFDFSTQSITPNDASTDTSSGFAIYGNRTDTSEVIVRHDALALDLEMVLPGFLAGINVASSAVSGWDHDFITISQEGVRFDDQFSTAIPTPFVNAAVPGFPNLSFTFKNVKVEGDTLLGGFRVEGQVEVDSLFRQIKRHYNPDANQFEEPLFVADFATDAGDDPFSDSEQFILWRDGGLADFAGEFELNRNIGIKGLGEFRNVQIQFDTTEGSVSAEAEFWIDRFDAAVRGRFGFLVDNGSVNFNEVAVYIEKDVTFPTMPWVTFTSLGG